MVCRNASKETDIKCHCFPNNIFSTLYWLTLLILQFLSQVTRNIEHQNTRKCIYFHCIFVILWGCHLMCVYYYVISFNKGTGNVHECTYTCTFQFEEWCFKVNLEEIAPWSYWFYVYILTWSSPKRLSQEGLDRGYLCFDG